MKYRVQIAMQNGVLPIDGWGDVEAGNMEMAAITHLRGLTPPKKREDYPITVFVSDNKLTHENGAPMCVHAFRFEVAKARV